jgi:hypothetical protein
VRISVRVRYTALVQYHVKGIQSVAEVEFESESQRTRTCRSLPLLVTGAVCGVEVWVSGERAREKIWNDKVSEQQ